MNKDELSLQAKAIAIYKFLSCFNELEKEIRKIFEKNLNKFDTYFINKLYFIYGGKIGTYIDYENGLLKLTENKYKEKEKFKELTIIQIINLIKPYNLIEEFKVEIKSLMKKTIYFEFYDICIKLINMRNILAHEITNINFKQKHIVELLSDEIIQKNLEYGTVNVMDEDTKIILSNLIYLKILLEKIKK